MALPLTPTRLPTLEPVVAAVTAALAADLAEALTVTEAKAVAAGLPTVTLTPPKEVRAVVVEPYSAQIVWPSVTVAAGDMNAQGEGEQRPVGQMRGEIVCDCWVEAPAGQMESALQRYGAAVWLVLINQLYLGHAEFERDTFAVRPDRAGGTAQRRGVEVTFSVKLRV